MIQWVKKFLVRIMAIGVRHATTPDAARHIGELNLLCFFSAGFTISVIILDLISGHPQYAVLMGGSCLSVLVAWYLLYKGVGHQIIGILSLIYMDILAVSMVITGGVGNASMVWIFLVPPLSLFVFGLRRGLVSLLFIFSALVIILFYPNDALLLATYSQPLKVRLLWSLMGVTVISVLVEFSRNRTHASLLEAMAEQNRTEGHRKALEEQLRQSQKMEAIGQLAGGISHDFNNLLTGIISHADFVKRDLEKRKLPLQDIDVVLSSATRAGNLTSQLLAFSRKQIIQTEIFSLAETIGNMEEIIRSSLIANISLNVSSNGTTGLIKADRTQVEQVLMNLVLNARDAMQVQGGTLTIETSSVEIADSRIAAQWDASPGSFVLLSVTDDGAGIRPKDMEHIFEPFFTTKELGRGTGLGMSTVFGIVKQHLGFIEVTSTLGEGTNMSVFWPRVYERPSPVPKPSPLRRVPEKSGFTVLLVEDDEVVRRSARRILDAAGYHVVEASSGEEAVKLIHSNSHIIHLLLTDVIMTGMTGVELVQHLEKSKPNVPFVLMSGYTEDAIDTECVLDDDTPFLAKPFSREGLLEIVKKTISRVDP